jgi:hypothetical protein
MKKLLFILCLLPSIAVARIQLGVNGGIQLNQGANAGPYLSGRLMLDTKFLLIGGAMDYSRITGTTATTPTFDYQHFYLSPNVFANYKLSLVKAYLYIGAAAGYNYTNATRIVFKKGSTTNASGVENASHHTYTFGGQAGLTIFPLSKIGFNLEAAVRNTRIESKGYTYVPISLGLRLKL